LTKRNYVQMNFRNSIISKLEPGYFWDVDLSVLDENSSSRLIIERIFSLGKMDEMNLVIQFYGQEKILNVLCNLPYIDPKTFNFIIKLFNKPAEEFKCFRRKQSNPQLWNS